MIIFIIIILNDIILPGFMTLFPELCSERKNKDDMIVVILAVILVVVVVVVPVVVVVQVVNNQLKLPDFLIQIFLHQHTVHCSVTL
jgi:hypothetical protein